MTADHNPTFEQQVVAEVMRRMIAHEIAVLIKGHLGDVPPCLQNKNHLLAGVVGHATVRAMALCLAACGGKPGAGPEIYDHLRHEFLALYDWAVKDVRAMQAQEAAATPNHPPGHA